MPNDFWTDDEVAQCNHAFRGEGGMWAAMTRAVELVAARGGTMTADVLAVSLERVASAAHTWDVHRSERDRLAAHIAAQGARIAALEQHVAELEKSLENARKERGEQQRQTELLTVTDSGKVVAMTGHIDHYSCSATCTHDDAANPGHSERVKSLSAAVAGCAHGDCGRSPCETCPSFGRGAEAMRAACYKAVQPLLQSLGFVVGGVPTEMGRAFKDAIEGATP